MNSNRKISVVISYCPNEKRFIHSVIRQCQYFSDDIIVVQSDHYLNGEKIETIEKFSKDYESVTDCIICFSKEIAEREGTRYYHNLFRYEGWMKTKHDYILFLDADEVPDGVRFREWLNLIKLEKFSAISLDAYWYFRDTKNRAITTEETSLIFRSWDLFKELFFNDMERWGMFYSRKNNGVRRNIMRRHIDPISKEPLIHHYSWVRTKEEMLRKVSSWGHRSDDINWADLVEKEFEHEFNGTDFVHGYTYEKGESFI